jgi:hypothetical protein
VVGTVNPFDAVDPPQAAKGGFFDDLIPAAKGANFYPTDEMPAANAPNWSAANEAVNAAAFGAGPAINEWLDKNAPAAVNGAGVGGIGSTVNSWLPSWATAPVVGTLAGQPVQTQGDRNAYAAQNPGTALAADMVGGSLPFLATGGAASGLGLGARALTAAATGAVGQGGSD